MSLLIFVSVYLEPLAYLLYVIAGFIFFRRTNTLRSKLFIANYFICLLLMLWIAVTFFTQQNNTWLYSLIFLITGSFHGLYYHQVFHSALKKKIALTSIVIVIVYFIYKYLVLKAELYDSLGFAMMAMLIVIFVFMYYHQLLRDLNEKVIYHSYDFWVNTGWLIYYLGSFMILLSFYFLTVRYLPKRDPKDQQILTMLWGVHNVLLFLSSLITLTTHVWIAYRSRSRSSSSSLYSL